MAGVITKPFRSSGILSTLVLARSAQGFQQRLQAKLDKLESTIKSRRQIEKAIRGLVDGGPGAAAHVRRAVRWTLHTGVRRHGPL